jgi:hypothetical protein
MRQQKDVLALTYYITASYDGPIARGDHKPALCRT